MKTVYVSLPIPSNVLLQTVHVTVNQNGRVIHVARMSTNVPTLFQLSVLKHSELHALIQLGHINVTVMLDMS